ncbi:hydrogenase nickel incorporation protein HypB [Saccharopolyspora sp. HNM0983]|uniref:Hydrogenase nickel incorporation protein HypB n=1 Tax=Saccharopolyspora montiporae TaxID=2781240 RepID=A0A929BC26_9PSEU|nr:hydrogenase nickel incorporation protein HypB [Saccharopolyspora sp. HNM0983]MBE9376020.1 hydrogenase nickel incorporation protein HypB [Saccharopolyspora sp. HNM0983]
MCATCGCGGTGPRVDGVDLELDHEHEQDHGHGHGHGHGPGHGHGSDGSAGQTWWVEPRTVLLEQDVLAKNDELARYNRDWLADNGITAINLMSSPGSGKTTLLERTIAAAGEIPISVVEGDQETPFDADRIRATGCRAVQVNTGAGCHLDAAMLAGALRELAPPRDSVVLVENVGNLVCPALFDLGELAKVVIMSVTEGADKPLKYPHMFRCADMVLLNKIDLLPHVDFDVARFTADAREVNPNLEIRQISATRGDGVADWAGWLLSRSRTRS